jgi:hypothetical protein
LSSKSSQVDLLRFGVFELDLAAGELRRNSRRILLQPQPFRILTLLASQPGMLVTREEVRRELWDGSVSVDFEQGMNFCIRRIRIALGDDADSPRFIETVRGADTDSSRRSRRSRPRAPTHGTRLQRSQRLLSHRRGQSPDFRQRPMRWEPS